MSRETLPSLSLRETRVRLLLWTLDDALTGGTLDGSGGDAPGSRLNLHGELWPNGSYQELDYALRLADRDVRRFLTSHYLAVPIPSQPKKDTPELYAITAALPPNLYVPADVALAAGYLEGVAKAWRMPRREQFKRYARVR